MSARRRRSCGAPLAALALLAALCGSLAGCSHIVRTETPYFNESPHQLAPPDGYLKAGTRVLVVGRKDSYARVWGAGVNAYVWEQALDSLWSPKKE